MLSPLIIRTGCCGNCRHSQLVPIDEFKRRLQIKDQDTDRVFSLEPLPAVQALLHLDQVPRCRLYGSFVAPDHSCEHYSRQITGTLITVLRSIIEGRDLDAELRRRVHEEREAALRKAREREDEIGVPQPPPAPSKCPHCDRIHPRCEGCGQERLACVVCPEHGHLAAVGKLPSGQYRWQSRHCDWKGEGPLLPAPAVWPENRCDGCRSLAQERARESA